MPFCHCVMFRFTPDVDAEHLAKLKAALDEMPSQVDSIRRYRHGADAGLSDGAYDYAVFAEFDDQDGYIVYRDHPFHQQLIRDLIMGFIAERSVVQFQA